MRLTRLICSMFLVVSSNNEWTVAVDIGNRLLIGVLLFFCVTVCVCVSESVES